MFCLLSVPLLDSSFSFPCGQQRGNEIISEVCSLVVDCRHFWAEELL